MAIAFGRCAGARIVMLVGAGALHAREEILAVADVLASPVVKALSGKAAVPDDHPLTTGGIGLLGTRPSEEAMEHADTVFMVLKWLETADFSKFECQSRQAWLFGPGQWSVDKAKAFRDAVIRLWNNWPSA